MTDMQPELIEQGQRLAGLFRLKQPFPSHWLGMKRFIALPVPLMSSENHTCQVLTTQYRSMPWIKWQRRCANLQNALPNAHALEGHPQALNDSSSR